MRWKQEGFAIRVRFMMHQRQTTQKTLAAKLGVAKSTMSQWLRDRAHYPSLDMLMCLAKVLKVNVCWLTFGCREHEPPEWPQFYNWIKTQAEEV